MIFLCRILSSSWDKTLCFFDVETGSVLWRAENIGIVMSCDLSPDGNYALSCVDYEDSIKILDVRTGTVLHDLPGEEIKICQYQNRIVILT